VATASAAIAEIDVGLLHRRHVGAERAAGQRALDHCEEMPAAVVDIVGIGAVARITDRAEHAVLDGLGKADDGVQRRAELVGELRHDAGLGFVGPHGVLALDRGARPALGIGLGRAQHVGDAARAPIGDHDHQREPEEEQRGQSRFELSAGVEEIPAERQRRRNEECDEDDGTDRVAAQARGAQAGDDEHVGLVVGVGAARREKPDRSAPEHAGCEGARGIGPGPEGDAVGAGLERVEAAHERVAQQRDAGDEHGPEHEISADRAVPQHRGKERRTAEIARDQRLPRPVEFAYERQFDIGVERAPVSAIRQDGCSVARGRRFDVHAVTYPLAWRRAQRR
jgi:hypothetical protein